MESSNIKIRKIDDTHYLIEMPYDVSKGVYCSYIEEEDSEPKIEALVRFYTIYKYGDFSEEMIRRNWIDHVNLNVDLIYKYANCRHKKYNEFVINDIDVIRKLENGDIETILYFVNKSI